MMVGGCMVNTKPSRIWLNAIMARPVKEAASLPGFLRSLQSLRETKPKPMFCPCPAKLKPCTVMMLATSGCCSMYFSVCSNTASVRSRVAPGGSCAITMREPWSSVGKKPVGNRTYISDMQAMMAPYTPIISQLRLSSLPIMPSYERVPRPSTRLNQLKKGPSRPVF